MESAPLTLAHNHARNAAAETKRSNPVAASEEHDLAATEFAAAAEGTHDSEARRILHLLEQHHKRLGQILKSTHEKPKLASQASPEIPSQSKDQPITDANPTAAPRAPGLIEQALSANAHPPPKLSRTTTPTSRDLSSSLVSNLASARGIPLNRPRRLEPASPAVSAQHAGGHFATEETSRRTLSRQSSDQRRLTRQGSSGQSHRPPWAPPTSSPLQETFTDGPEKVDETAKDAPFQQFYNTFEGLLSKFSAPLAFAGFPLNSTVPEKDVPEISSKTTIKSKKPTRATALDASMDYSSLFSRAALRAVRDGAPSNPAESFYVVPTTGGTISYAEIMSRAERESKHAPRGYNREPSGLSEDDFHDARTTAPSVESLDLKASTSGRKGGLLSPDTKTVAGKTMEELALENQALKHLSDTLSRKLHVFELSSQSSSAALAQSIRSLQRSPMTTPENSGRGTKLVGDDRMKARVTELEDILKKSDRENQRRRDENAKLKETLKSYRAKWDKLKESARSRRERPAPGGTTAADTNDVEAPEVELGAPVEPDRERLIPPAG